MQQRYKKMVISLVSLILLFFIGCSLSLKKSKCGAKRRATTQSIYSANMVK